MRFRDFVGNQRMTSLLRKGALPPSSIFWGPAGIGKKTCALSLAAMTNCVSPKEGDLCGECQSCVKAESGNHPDIRLYEPERTGVKIEAMREMCREAQFHPFQGRLRFFIIDRAETMTEAAANSILKTLEEPPPKIRLVLVTSSYPALLPTIRSRCQLFRFRPLERDQIEAYLEETDLGEEASLRAGFAGGSIGAALSIDLASLREERDRMLEMLSGWLEDESFEALFRRLEEPAMRPLLRKKETVRALVDSLQLLCQDLYFLKVGTGDRVVNRDRVDELDRLAGMRSLEWIRNFLYHIGQTQWDVDRYVNPLMCFETLWLNSGKRFVHVANRHG